jgi:hypothetical protein
MTNAIDCMYSKLSAKYIEDIYWNKLRKEVHFVGSYYADN